MKAGKPRLVKHAEPSTRQLVESELLLIRMNVDELLETDPDDVPVFDDLMEEVGESWTNILILIDEDDTIGYGRSRAAKAARAARRKKEKMAAQMAAAVGE